ncbi:MAG: metallophosphoesterase family protein [Planctomycetota bacterium]
MSVLFLADTHIGIDMPARPRVARRRRGPDFLDAFERALEPARRGEVDFVVHGGDLLYRARVPAGLVQRAMAPLMRVADLGVPVFLVPGNHERSRIPYPLLTLHEHVHIFRAPDTFTLDVRGLRIALSGFPFARRVAGAPFRALVERTRWREHDADVRLLCLHQTVEGAQVGVQNYTFLEGDDVVCTDDVPRAFAAVLSGHIHRWQVLVDPPAPPVLYPGSVERTSFAERLEEKGYLRLRLGADGLRDWTFVPLPTRPMEVVRWHGDEAELRARLGQLSPHAVVRIEHTGARGRPPTAARLREFAPPTMNISVRASVRER